MNIEKMVALGYLLIICSMIFHRQIVARVYMNLICLSHFVGQNLNFLGHNSLSIINLLLLFLLCYIFSMQWNNSHVGNSFKLNST